MCLGRIALRQNFLSHYGRQLGTLSGLLGLALVLWALTPHFLTISNLLNIAEQATIIAIIAVGMTFVIITGVSIYRSVRCWLLPVWSWQACFIMASHYRWR